jgi:ABC-type spermidine/putrescine transport system permease subunit II
MSVRVSPISKTAAIIITALGLFLLFGGLAAQDELDTIAGFAITVLGLVLYRLLYRFTRKVTRELEEAAKAS